MNPLVLSFFIQHRTLEGSCAGLLLTVVILHISAFPLWPQTTCRIFHLLSFLKTQSLLLTTNSQLQLNLRYICDNSEIVVYINSVKMNAHWQVLWHIRPLYYISQEVIDNNVPLADDSKKFQGTIFTLAPREHKQRIWFSFRPQSTTSMLTSPLSLNTLCS